MSPAPERPDPLAEPEGYGSKLGGLEHLTRRNSPGSGFALADAGSAAGVTPGVVPDGGEDDHICSWYTPPAGVRCREERAWVIVAGDLAEHISSLDLCDNHLTVVAAQPRFWCTVCRRDMHLEKVGAVVDGEVVWLDETGWPGTLRRPELPPERLF
jgi:hypothetical protein